MVEAIEIYKDRVKYYKRLYEATRLERYKTQYKKFEEYIELIKRHENL